jgi:hypothetical protein
MRPRSPSTRQELGIASFCGVAIFSALALPAAQINGVEERDDATVINMGSGPGGMGRVLIAFDRWSAAAKRERLTISKDRQTLEREILEEACARVTGARLLGFVRGRCADGGEKGLVLVRSIWRAEVTLLPWRPEHEIPFRRTVPASELARYLWTEPGTKPIYARAAREAGLTLPS